MRVSALRVILSMLCAVAGLGAGLQPAGVMAIPVEHPELVLDVQTTGAGEVILDFVSPER